MLEASRPQRDAIMPRLTPPTNAADAPAETPALRIRREGLSGQLRGSELLALLDDPSSEVRMAAANIAAVMRDPACKDRLILMLDDPDANLRALAASGVGRYRDPALAARLEALTNDANPVIRSCAVSGLIDLGSSEARTAVVAAITREANTEIRQRMLAMLLAEPTVQRALAAELAPEVRRPLFSDLAGVARLARSPDPALLSFLDEQAL